MQVFQNRPKHPGFSRAVGRASRMAGLFLLLSCCAVITPPAPARPAAEAQKYADRIVGAWRLVSVEGNSPMRRVDYDHPIGMIVYDRSGWMSVQIAIHGERKAFAHGVSAGATEEKAEAFDTYLAYYGTYVVNGNEGTVTHHIADHSYPGYRGRDNVRWFEFQGDDRIVLIPTEDGKGGSINRKDATYKLTWERIRQADTLASTSQCPEQTN